MTLHEAQKPDISILGCGWYGLPLAKKLVDEGYAVKGSTTAAAKIAGLAASGVEPYLIDVDQEDLELSDFFNSEVLIISIPPRRNSPTWLQYAQKLGLVAKAAARGKIKEVFLISSTSVFGDINGLVNEDTPPQPENDPGSIIYAAEQLLSTEPSFRTTILRFTGLIGPGRNLARHFAGKANIANGLAPVNLIHLADCIGLTLSIIKKRAYGKIYHGVMPDHPARSIFYTAACLNAGMEKPRFIDEKVNWKQVDSVNVAKFVKYDYIFDNAQKLLDALQDPDV